MKKLTPPDAKDIASTLIPYVLNNPYIPHTPTPRQAVFLSLKNKEVLFGGAVAGGKSDALLMAALMYVILPGYNAILFRKTFTDLSLPDSLIPRSHEWLNNTDAKWNGSDYRWTFPTGSTLSFGYLNTDKDKYRYQSAQFQFIGFDELTQFPSEPYRYLFSRLRRLKNSTVPIRMRAATNPGDGWVFERFIVDNQRPFVPSLLTDNPYIDADEYRKSLLELDDITRQQLEFGLWVSDPQGKPFKREWWYNQNRYTQDELSLSVVGRWLSFDTALEDKKESAYSAYCVGEILSNYSLRIRHVWRDKLIFPDLPNFIETESVRWNKDDKLKEIVIEGKASGKPAIQTLRASTNKEISSKIVEYQPRGSKEERANQAGIWCKRGMVQLPYPSSSTEWLNDFETELFAFPQSENADQVDCFSQLVNYLENYLASGWHGTIAKKNKMQKESRIAKALRRQRKK